MTSQKLRFAIFGNVFQPKKSASIRRLLSCLASYGDEVSMDRAFYDFLRKSCNNDNLGVARVFDGNDFDADFVISMGGDGTLLKAAARVGAKQIPIVGVNMGRLGFLADVTSVDIEACIKDLHNGDFNVEDRGALQVETVGGKLNGPRYALNDVAILKRDDASMIAIHATINGETLTTYQADGLVVCTPTGSTAYSLSNGGPIIVPGTHVFAVTAVASHSLNTRPIVIGDDSVLEFRVESRSHNFLIAVDGHSEKCVEGVVIRVKKAPHTVRIVKHLGNNYFETLREKMMWGADGRE